MPTAFFTPGGTKIPFVFTPPHYPAIKDWPLAGDWPTVFIAGPIQGAPNWQKEAGEILVSLGCMVASPRTENPREIDYDVQVDWEHHWLAYCRANGAVAFWLANEAEHNCKRAYGQTTRFELGEHIAYASVDPRIDVVVGIDPGFSNERYIRKTIGKKTNIFVYDTLRDTCEIAAMLAKTRVRPGESP